MELTSRVDKKNLKQATRNLYIGIFSLVLVLLLGYMTTQVSGGLYGEEIIYHILDGLRSNKVAFGLMKIFHHLGSPKFLIPIIGLVLVYSLYKKKKIFALGLFLATAGSAVLNFATKITFKRLRPLDYMLIKEVTPSFPSGHAMTNTCLYLFLAYYYSRHINPGKKKEAYTLAIIFSVIMGFSRIYMGVHYPTDVLAGFLSGYFFYSLIAYILEKIKIENRR